MLGSGGAAKIVNDMSSLADIARAIGDSSKAEKLETIRDEFNKSLEEIQNQEKKVQEKINELLIKESQNKLKEDELKNKQKILDDLTKALKIKEDSFKISSLQIMADQSSLKIQKEDFDRVRADWIDLRDKESKSLIVEKEKIKTELDKREKTLKAREDAVSTRENNVSIKETSLFKQSQLAEAFIKSIK